MFYTPFYNKWIVEKASHRIRLTFNIQQEAEECVFKEIICSDKTSRGGILCRDYVPRQCLRDKRLPNISRLVKNNSLTEEEKKYLNITVYELDKNIDIYKKWGYNVNVRDSEENYVLFKKMVITDPNIVKNYILLENLAALLNINFETVLGEKEMSQYKIAGIEEVQDMINDDNKVPDVPEVQDMINVPPGTIIDVNEIDSEKVILTIVILKMKTLIPSH